MMHLDRLRLTSQQSDIFLERLRLPEAHMRLNALPPDRNHSRLAFDAFVLNLFVRDPVRDAQIPGRRSLSLQPLACFRRITRPIPSRLTIAVKRRNLRHRRAERCVQSSRGLEIHVVDVDGAGHDGRAALQVRLVGV